MSKFHINKHGVPAPCKATKGKCPLGGDSGNEGHFDSEEEAQAHADNVNQKEYGVTPEMQDETVSDHYNGSYHSMPQSARDNFSKKSLDESNVQEVLDEGLQNGGVSVKYETDSFNNTPVEFDATISKTGDNEYQVDGEIHEFSMAEEDFDSEEEYDEYVSGEPDMTYDVSYKFKSDDLKESLVESESIRNGTNPKQNPGVIMSGVYDMSREEI